MRKPPAATTGPGRQRRRRPIRAISESALSNHPGIHETLIAFYRRQLPYVDVGSTEDGRSEDARTTAETATPVVDSGRSPEFK